MADEKLNDNVENEDTADEETGNTEQAQHKKNKSGSIKIKLIYSVLSCVITIVVMLAFFLLKENTVKGAQVKVDVEKTIKMEKVEVNLLDMQHTLRMQVALTTSGGVHEEWLVSQKSFLTDLLIQMAQKKSLGTLRTEIMRNKFKREILEEFNYRIDSKIGRIKGVYFTEFYITPNQLSPVEQVDGCKRRTDNRSD